MKVPDYLRYINEMIIFTCKIDITVVDVSLTSSLVIYFTDYTMVIQLNLG